MNKKYLYIFFALMVAAQFYVPLRMIFSSEKIINSDQVYKFKTVPRDPVDPFRGKYITLRYAVEREAYSIDTLSINTQYNQPLFAFLKLDEDGFALIDTVLVDDSYSHDYIIIDDYNIYGSQMYINLPFDKFFMNEYKAKPAEDAVRALRSDTSKTVYGLVHVLEGKSILKDVMINDVSIRDYVELHEND